MKRIAIIAIVLGLVQLAVPSAFAQFVITQDKVAYGRTYGEWSAAWWQWALSIPVANHPLFDNGPCSVGQSGPIEGPYPGGSYFPATSFAPPDVWVAFPFVAVAGFAQLLLSETSSMTSGSVAFGNHHTSRCDQLH